MRVFRIVQDNFEEPKVEEHVAAKIIQSPRNCMVLHFLTKRCLFKEVLKQNYAFQNSH